VRATNPGITDRVKAGFYLTMCLKQEGDNPGSIAALEQAETQFQHLPKVSDGDLGADVLNVLICHIARREARGALGMAAPPAMQSAR
jgi:hypothetical protein